MLEVNQAGLSWLTILKKRAAFRAAYDRFDPERVARYGAREVKRLLGDAGIIRNRLKVEAAIANARCSWSAREPRIVRRVAGRPPSPEQGGVGQAVQEDLQIHRGEIVGDSCSAPGICRARIGRVVRSTSRS
jgi:hypothetical protein